MTTRHNDALARYEARTGAKDPLVLAVSALLFATAAAAIVAGDTERPSGERIHSIRAAAAVTVDDGR